MISRRLLLASGGALAARGAFAQAAAPQVKLRLNTIAPRMHFFTQRTMQHWQDEVARVTQGRVAVEATPAPLGGMPQAFDLARTGVADVSPGDHAPIAGRFDLMRIINMPFMGGDATRMSVALWRVYNQFLAPANEHAGAQLLSVWTHSPLHIFAVAKPIRSSVDFEGLKVLTSGATATRIAQLLGAVIVNAPVTQYQDLVSRGVVDALITARPAVTAFGLLDHIKHYLEIPGGLMYTSQFLVMNPSKWAGLSEADRTAIMSVSGETFARFAGGTFAEEDIKAEAQIKGGKVTVEKASPAFIADLEKRLQPVVDEWMALAQGRGIDGRAALALLRQAGNA
jgi:TRAP-type C4-dicarboxylate transport system substrate-binding protein